ncbi:MAG: ABC transporter permease [Actinomycetota bacterium]|nr:ABC transporter permease [Actinomycetota bacterium]
MSEATALGQAGPVLRRGRLFVEVARTPGGAVGLVLVGFATSVGLLADLLSGAEPFAAVAEPLSPPAAQHLLGTDDLGRDLAALVLHGLRTSLLVGAAVGVMAGVIGIAVGAASGSRGGLVDDALMRATELFQVIPRFFLAVVVVALFGPGLVNLIVLLGLTSWPWTARVVRAEVLSLKQRDFVAAARSLGAGELRVLLRHLVPNALPAAVVMVTLVASSAILIEAGLGFVGLTDPDVVSLGYLANNAQRFLRVAWWMVLFPGIAIVLLVVGLNLLGDTVNELLNPWEET